MKWASILLIVAWACGACGATWGDANAPYRRYLEVQVDAGSMSAKEIATADFYVHGETAGGDVRVYTDDGKAVPTQLLVAGPGDRVRVAFVLQKGKKNYYAYWGNPKAKAGDVFAFNRGVLAEFKKLPAGGLPSNFAQMTKTWNSAGDVFGRAYIADFFLGFNPINQENNVIVKFSGTMNVAKEGEYGFAMAAANKGALYIDGSPLVFANSAPGDARFSGKTTLTKGEHSITAYVAHQNNEHRMTVAWMPPGQTKYSLMGENVLGKAQSSKNGFMEVKDKTLVADMVVDYMGETFVEGHYIHTYKFLAPPGNAGDNLEYKWEFGDGQTSVSRVIEHAYLKEGEFKVKLTATRGNQTESRTDKVKVERMWEKISDPPVVGTGACSRIVETYAVNAMDSASLLWGIPLELKANRPEIAGKFAMKLATMTGGVDARTAVEMMGKVSDQLTLLGKVEEAGKIWNEVKTTSVLEPMASKRYAGLLLWRLGDFDGAEKRLAEVMKKFPKDEELMRLEGMALVLTGKAGEGRKMLEGIKGTSADKKAAMAGAQARTVEFYVDEGDVENGDLAWEKWMAGDPGDFLEGYSVLLKAKLIEKAKYPVAAAKLAETFATRMPKSSYSPRLIDFASKMLERSDPKKSGELRKLLKEKYPEDPLSQ